MKLSGGIGTSHKKAIQIYLLKRFLEQQKNFKLKQKVLI